MITVTFAAFVILLIYSKYVPKLWLEVININGGTYNCVY